MKKTILFIDLKKVFILFFIILFFIVILPLIIIGVDKKQSNNVRQYNERYKENNNSPQKDFSKIKVYLSKEDKVQELNLEEYIVGVVAAEMPATFEKEALKAQAIAARTFAISKIINNCNNGKGADICDNTHCQVFLSKEERIKTWNNSSSDAYWEKVKDAVKETEGQVLTYNGNIAMRPQYFAVSGGRTENASEVFAVAEPYLKSVDSPGEEIAPKYMKKVSISISEFIKKVNNEFSEAKLSSNKLKGQVVILSRNEGGSVKEIKLGGATLTGTQVRKLFSLNSANFDISVKKNNVEVTCKGYGHGVGMSQWGANVMAKKGAKCNEILLHYYNGIEITEISKLL